MTMKPIGGYFELELGKGPYQYHHSPCHAKSGRAALRLILSVTKPSLVYIPFYTCDSLIESFEATNINYRFYPVNDRLEPLELPELASDESFLYVNYLGIKDKAVAALSRKYGLQLIVDCTQAFFMKGNGVSWYFNSCRKFFGVPDGSYLYVPSGIKIEPPESRNEDYVTGHLIKRFNGHSQEGYPYFRQNEELAGQGTTGMSKLTEYLLSHVNYDEIVDKRRRNYNYLQEQFLEVNEFKADLYDASVPMAYPMLMKRVEDKTAFFAANIFIPVYWEDTKKRNVPGFGFEKEFTDRLWPLPVDHRYNIEDLEILCKSIKDKLF